MSTVLVLSVVASVGLTSVVSLHFLLILFTPFPTPTHLSERTYTITPTSPASPLPSVDDAPTVALSIIIPAYNEEERLGYMLDDLMAFFGRPKNKGLVGQGVEVLVIDDGSTDSTTGTAQRYAMSHAGEGLAIRAVTLRTNRGKGGAVQHGVLHSRGKLILFADADGATRFADLDLLLVAMDEVKDEDGHGMVVGSRAHLVKSDAVVKIAEQGAECPHAWLPPLPADTWGEENKGYPMWVQGMLLRFLPCLAKSSELFTRPTARLLFPTLHLPRWSFDVELLLFASLIVPPIPVREVPVVWHEISGSKIRLGWDSVGMARDLLVLRGNLATGRWVVPHRPANVVESNGETMNGLSGKEKAG